MKKVFLLLSFLALAGCAGTRAAPLACPDTGFFPDTDRAVFMAGDGGLVAEVRLGHLRGHCKVQKNGATEVALRFDITGRSGASGGAVQDVTYFVAVLSDENIVGQPVQETVSVKLDAAGGMGRVAQEYRVTLPPVAADGASWRVVLGLNLTPEQLDFNRKGRQK